MMNEGTTTSAPDVSTSRLCPVWRRALVTQLCQEIRRKTTDGPEAETTATTTSCGNPACEFRHEFLSRFEADQLRESAEASARCREEYERLALAHTRTLDGTRTTSIVSKHKRASVFAEWFAEKYGNKLKTTLNDSSNTSSSLVQDKDLLILDVAGGSGDLSVILRAEHGFRNVYTIDPWKPRRWKTWQLRKMQDRTLVSRKREFDDESETNCGSAQILDAHFVQESFPMIWGGRAVASDDSGPPIGCSDRLRLLIGRCDVIVGLHPDQATEAIVACAQQLKKPFAVVPCCVFAHLFPGRELMDVHYGRKMQGLLFLLLLGFLKKAAIAAVPDDATGCAVCLASTADGDGSIEDPKLDLVRLCTHCTGSDAGVLCKDCVADHFANPFFLDPGGSSPLQQKLKAMRERVRRFGAASRLPADSLPKFSADDFEREQADVLMPTAPLSTTGDLTPGEHQLRHFYTSARCPTCKMEGSWQPSRWESHPGYKNKKGLCTEGKIAELIRKSLLEMAVREFPLHFFEWSALPDDFCPAALEQFADKMEAAGGNNLSGDNYGRDTQELLRAARGGKNGGEIGVLAWCLEEQRERLRTGAEREHWLPLFARLLLLDPGRGRSAPFPNFASIPQLHLDLARVKKEIVTMLVGEGENIGSSDVEEILLRFLELQAVGSRNFAERRAQLTLDGDTSLAEDLVARYFANSANTRVVVSMGTNIRASKLRDLTRREVLAALLKEAGRMQAVDERELVEINQRRAALENVLMLCLELDVTLFPGSAKERGKIARYFTREVGRIVSALPWLMAVQPVVAAQRTDSRGAHLDELGIEKRTARLAAKLREMWDRQNAWTRVLMTLLRADESTLESAAADGEVGRGGMLGDDAAGGLLLDVDGKKAIVALLKDRAGGRVQQILEEGQKLELPPATLSEKPGSYKLIWRPSRAEERAALSEGKEIEELLSTIIRRRN
eukprot:g15547.t1